MTPSFHSPSRYLHLCTPSRTLGPASGEVGELVARPPFMWASLAVTDFLMLQVVSPSFTNKTLGSPSTFLNTGRPLLHFPSSNLLKMYILFGFHRHGISDNFLTYNHRGFSLAFPQRRLPQPLWWAGRLPEEWCTARRAKYRCSSSYCSRPKIATDLLVAIQYFGGSTTCHCPLLRPDQQSNLFRCKKEKFLCLRRCLFEGRRASLHVLPPSHVW